MIDVVYLAYLNEELGYDIDVFEQFIESYKKFSAGIEHNLTILIKNSTPEHFYNKLLEHINKNNLKILKVSDEGLDIGAFILAAKELQSEYMFCIGSGVSILCHDWLRKFYNAFKNNSVVQLAGAMGTYAKGHSDRFPNPHIRTCAFMMKRKLFLEYADSHKFPQTKEDTWEIEHGMNSLTSFVLDKGYHVVVVNNESNVFYQNDWEIAQTYITLDSKAIMDDKWARRYALTDEYLRTKIEMENWSHNTTKYPSNLVKKFSSKINVFIPYFNIVPVYSTEVFHPIFTGDINTKLVTDALQDSTDANIFSKSGIYGELSAYYWVWKNFTDSRAGLLSRQLQSEYIGFCQFYHFFDFNSNSKVFAPFNLIYLDEFAELFKNYSEENVLNFTQGYDVVMPAKIPLNTSLYEQYLNNHKQDDVDLALDTIKKIYPNYTDAVDKAMAANSMYPLGNFIMKKEVFNEFCEWLFNVLDVVEKRINWNVYGKYRDIVSSAFISERFLNIWLEYNANIESQSKPDIDLESRVGLLTHQCQTDEALIAAPLNLNIKVAASFMVSPDERKFLNKTLSDIQQVKNQIRKK